MITLPSTLRARAAIVWIKGVRYADSLPYRHRGFDERDFRQIEPFAQQIDADEHVELALAQIAQDPIRSSVSTSLCK